MALKINHTVTIITRIVGWGLLAAVILYFGRVFIWEQVYYKEQSAQTRAKSQAVITKLPELRSLSKSEITDEAYKKHSVENGRPKYLKIDRLHVDTIVESGVINTGGILSAPKSIYSVNWYAGSAQPNQDGVILITGISSYENMDGAFANLDTLEKGDTIQIIGTSNQSFEYEVQTSSITSEKDAATTIPNAQQRIDGKETLSLISIAENDQSSIVVVKATRK